MFIVTSLSTHAMNVQNQNFLVKMKAPCLLILVVMQLSRIADCCSSNINIDNAFVSCLTNNVSCNAECYRGYIFPNGSTKENYSCQNGVWTPIISSCKRIPSVSVTYSAIWVFSEVLTSSCANISSRLDNLREVLEGTLAKSCQLLEINATVQFTHLFLAFQLHSNFIAVYDNFTNWETLDLCIHYNLATFRKHQVTKSMFEGVTCGNLNTNNTIHKDLFVKETYDICPSATELYNVSTSEDGMYIRYCDFTDIDLTITMTKPSTEPTQMRTSKSPTIQTEVAFTGMNFGVSQHTSQGTTLRTEVSSPDQNSRVNRSQITTVTITSLSGAKDFILNSEAVYILVPITGVFLILGIVTLVVCRRKRIQVREREKSYETIITCGQTQYINMADSSHHYDVIGYRR